MATTAKESIRDMMIDCFADLFRRAEAAAIAADPGPEDGGTCNLDTPCFRVKGWPEQNIMEAARRAGVRCTSFQWLGAKAYWLHVTMNGQAHRRERMMEAAQRVLNAAEPQAGLDGIHPNYTACGYYVMD